MQRTQVGQQLLGVGKALLIGSFKPTEFAQVLNAGGFQSENDLCEVQAFDFGYLLLGAVPVLVPGPKAETDARGRAPCPTGTLIRGGLTDLLYEQGVDASVRVVTSDPRQTAIDHAPNAINGERSLRHIRRNHDLASIITSHRSVLVARREFTVQRQENEPARGIRVADSLNGLGDLEAAGHKHQYVSFSTREDKILKSRRGLLPDGALVEVGGRARVAHLNIERPAKGFENVARLQVVFQSSGIQRRRHHNNFEVWADGLLEIQCAG